MSAATELMVDIAKIQQAHGTKRTALIAAARTKFGKVQWSSPTMKLWSRWAFLEGTR